jgi:hypothetical protein
VASAKSQIVFTSEGTAPRWFEPGRFFNLWEFMKKIKGQMIVSVSNQLTILETEAKLEKGDLAITDRQALRRRIDAIVKDCAFLEVESMLDQARRIRKYIDDSDPLSHEMVGTLIRSLIERFSDDLGRCHLLLVPNNRASLFTGKQLFGPRVYEAFPSAIMDIEEAGKCLALSRGTATVFHLMRVMEAGLKATAHALSIRYAPSWESYLDQIKAKMDIDWKKKSKKWRKEEPFFRVVHAHLHAVKLAWRNPTMHIVQNYSPEVAEEIFNAVKGFMRHIETKLSEPKTRLPVAKKILVSSVTASQT